MKVRKLSRIDTFDIMGKWWKKDIPEDSVFGTLKYTPESITLELVGVLCDEGDLFNFDREVPNEIYGVSVNGESFKINVLSRISASTPSPGIPGETYSVRSFLVGNYTEEFPENFDNILYNADYLTQWIAPQVFEETRIPRDNYYKIEYSVPETRKYNIESLNSIIEETFMGNTRMDYLSNIEVKARHTSWFKIIPEQSRDIDWFLKVIRSFKGFLNLLIDYTTTDENIILRVFKSEENRYLEYKYFESIKEVKKKKKGNVQFLFDYEDLKEKFGEIMNSWFEKEDKLITILTFHLHNFENLYIDSKYINAVQALEIFHRRFYEGNTIEQDLYIENAEKIKRYIEDNIDNEEVKSFFLGKFKHGNEYNLGKRLKELINGLSSEVKSFLIGNSENRDRFIQKTVETRNYLTHYDMSKKTMILKEPFEKFFNIYRMKLILIFVVLKKLGVEEKLIFDKVQKHRQMSSLLNQAKDVLNKKNKTLS
ncbi:ApeA N-terminal domain 1-containing protein [Bacillus sp. RHFS10]|nr:HEPN domain-containing protein [Bacillus sp. RHFS10]MBL3648863.1 hypothetical protein [Bacillus sp. RHFS10]